MRGLMERFELFNKYLNLLLLSDIPTVIKKWWPALKFKFSWYLLEVSSISYSSVPIFRGMKLETK